LLTFEITEYLPGEEIIHYLSFGISPAGTRTISLPPPTIHLIHLKTMFDIQSRQNLNGGESGEVVEYTPSFWWTRTGEIIKWTVFFGLFFIVMAYIVGGYWHAQRRMARGLPPLAYHRMLVNRQQRARFDPNYQNSSNYYYAPYQPRSASQDQYGMHPMPPPMYDPDAPMPPAYQLPDGATKVDPSQRIQPTTRPVEAADSSQSYYASPPGPPPAVH